MKVKSAAGFRELRHSSDAAIEIWASDLAGLFQQAVLGMQALMDARPAPGIAMEHALVLTGPDDESLLVAFLSQVLFLVEQERRLFSVVRIKLEAGRLDATLTGLPLGSIQREIKAVTFNELAIRRVNDGLKVKIVFDL